MKIEKPHNQKGHFNICQLDHDSVVTGQGKHDRVMACCPEGNEAYARVDLIWNLGFPTNEQIIKVFKEVNNVKGKWIVKLIDYYDCGQHADIYLERIIN
jgi:hypothetical protein